MYDRLNSHWNFWMLRTGDNISHLAYSMVQVLLTLTDSTLLPTASLPFVCLLFGLEPVPSVLSEGHLISLCPSP